MTTSPLRQLRRRQEPKPPCSPAKPCIACMPTVSRKLFKSGSEGRIPEMPGVSQMQDPLDILISDLHEMILAFLDCKSLATCTLVCKKWGLLARSDALWTPHLKELCSSKARIPNSVGPLTTESIENSMKRFNVCLRDAKRLHMTEEDLCGSAFEFRFKWSAGDFWRNLDPSWRAEPPFIRIFQPDNVVAPGPNDTIFNSMTWKFTKSKDGRQGRYVRINQWPSMTVSRTDKWGWKMQNCWVVYTSMPDVEMDRKLPEGLRTEVQSRR